MSLHLSSRDNGCWRHTLRTLEAPLLQLLSIDYYGEWKRRIIYNCSLHSDRSDGYFADLQCICRMYVGCTGFSPIPLNCHARSVCRLCAWTTSHLHRAWPQSSDCQARGIRDTWLHLYQLDCCAKAVVRIFQHSLRRRPESLWEDVIYCLAPPGAWHERYTDCIYCTSRSHLSYVSLSLCMQYSFCKVRRPGSAGFPGQIGAHFLMIGVYFTYRLVITAISWGFMHK